MRYFYLLSCQLLVLVGVSLPAHAEYLLANASRVIDGDTLEVLTDTQSSVRVRLQGIDAPELSQAYGDAARQSLAQCLLGHTVVVRGDKTDRYGRTVGVVYADGVDCNLNQIKLGMAWHYKAYQAEQSAAERRDYARAETQARAARLGLWAECAIAPWDWRKGERQCTAAPVSTATATPTAISANSNMRQSSVRQDNPLAPSRSSAQCQRYSSMTCKQFTSCSQAKQALACGNQRLDGDKDGVPCESLCR